MSDLEDPASRLRSSTRPQRHRRSSVSGAVSYWIHDTRLNTSQDSPTSKKKKNGRKIQIAASPPPPSSLTHVHNKLNKILYTGASVLATQPGRFCLPLRN